MRRNPFTLFGGLVALLVVLAVAAGVRRWWSARRAGGEAAGARPVATRPSALSAKELLAQTSRRNPFNEADYANDPVALAVLRRRSDQVAELARGGADVSARSKATGWAPLD